MMIEIRPRQEKCVKAYTKKIHGTTKKNQIDFLYKTYNIALEHFYQQFCGINYMVAVKNGVPYAMNSGRNLKTLYYIQFTI